MTEDAPRDIRSLGEVTRNPPQSVLDSMREVEAKVRAGLHGGKDAPREPVGRRDADLEALAPDYSSDGWGVNVRLEEAIRLAREARDERDALMAELRALREERKKIKEAGDRVVRFWGEWTEHHPVDMHGAITIL